MTSEPDYIVIGSGSAGAAVAVRLSEDRDVSVLLLEAGGRDSHPFQLMPLAFLKLGQAKRGLWEYFSEPEPGLNGRRLRVARGRTLGGSSSINAMIAIRGNARDYDIWAEQGCTGWAYADVLPYFKRLEHSWRGAGPYHGADGPVGISLMEGNDLLYEPLLAAARAAGIAESEDPNGVVQDGISRMEATIGAGKRASAARAYLYPALARPNLTIARDALTERILVEGGRAVGVAYAQGSERKTVRAAREVILCAGAFNSPQLLLLSGIGPADELRALGIDPVHDLPGVGRNLADHPNVVGSYALKGGEGLTRHLRYDKAGMLAALWYARSVGPFAWNGASANIFLRTQQGLDRPDVQLITMPVSNYADLWLRRPKYEISVRGGALHPKSRGWVKLGSADPTDAPRIQFNMFAEPDDLATMVRAVKAIRDLYAQAPLGDMIASEVLPGPDVRTDADIADYLRANAWHRAHPVGTCRMGVDDDAVVDPELRVRGIEGLRVADASIMPEVPGGNTNLPTIMIGERAADFVLGKNLPPAKL
jgi:choline dehydrogenase